MRKPARTGQKKKRLKKASPPAKRRKKVFRLRNRASWSVLKRRLNRRKLGRENSWKPSPTPRVKGEKRLKNWAWSGKNWKPALKQKSSAGNSSKKNAPTLKIIFD